MADISQIRLPSGDTFDLIDEKSGYITAQYIENKTDYSIPVSRVGEIVVGETAIGTDSTNFPTSKAVVDYVDERVVQEIDAIDVGVTGIKANGTSLNVVDGVVNIPIVSETQLVGLMTDKYMSQIYSQIRTTRNQIPTSTSQLTNDSGFITSETDPTVPAWAKASTKPTYTASEVGALPDSTVITDEKLKVNRTSDNGTYYPILTSDSTEAQTKLRYAGLYSTIGNSDISLTIGSNNVTNFKTGKLQLTKHTFYTTVVPSNNGQSNTITLPNKTGTVALLDDIPTVPTNISSFTNDSGYLTASDIASVMSYKGTKANYAALPSTGNTTGDVWHLTDTGAEWAWDGSAWQELGTAIDLSGYVESSRTADSTTTVFLNSGIGGSIQSTYQGTDNEAYIQTNADSEGAAVELYASDGINSNQIMVAPIGTFISNIVTPVDNTDAANKKYVDDSIGALSIPTKTSDLTNDSGFLTSYTETDPVFSASAAAGITSTDISNWNAKVSDDKTWNGVTLSQGLTYTAADQYIPVKATNALSGTASQTVATPTPTQYRIAKYDNNACLNSTTPSANDNSTKVATTAYVDTAIPKVYSSTNTGGYLTMATLPIYDGTVV